MTIATYNLTASNGKHIRKATQVTLADGQVIRFMELLTKREVGQQVLCNGYPGTITEFCEGQLQGMAVVRLNSGSVCVDSSELRPA